MTQKTLPPQPADQIKKLEAERNDLSKQLGKAHGAENARIHTLIAEKHRQLGKLYLERDKLERPEIYATEEPSSPSQRERVETGLLCNVLHLDFQASEEMSREHAASLLGTETNPTPQPCREGDDDAV